MPPKRQRKSKKQQEHEDDDSEITTHVKNLLKKSDIVVQSVPTGKSGTHLVSSVPSYQHGKPQRFSNKEKHRINLALSGEQYQSNPGSYNP